MSLIDLLQQVQNPATQAAAELRLKEAEEQNFAAYVVELSKLLALQSAPLPSRALAGVLLKLGLSGQSESFQKRKRERWLNTVTIEQRNLSKQAVLASLQVPESDVSRAAAQAIAAIANIELPAGQWNDLIPALTSTAISPTIIPDQKVASLQALGYICEMVEVNVIPSSFVNGILNAINQSMSDDLPEKLYLAGATAMLNTLVFAEQNMKNANERNMILTMIVKATKSKYEHVRVKGYESIAKTASHYYEYLGEYMEGIYESTFNAVQRDSEEVGMQALEFWTTLAEEEMFLIDEATENPDIPSKCQNYIAKVGKQLCELIMSYCLIKQDEHQEEDARNLANAAALCLGYVAQLLKNQILPFILPFVEQNINNPDWRRREAAVLSFGAMLDGPHQEVLQTPLLAAFETVLSKMLRTYEPHVMVRDTAAWAISVVCNMHITLLDNQKHLENLIKSLMQGLDDEARVAKNVAFAIHNFAKAFSPFADDATNKLSPMLQHFIAKLLAVSLREDRNEWELAQNCYEAINSLVENSAQDMSNLILKLLEEILRRLEVTVAKSPNTSEEKEEKDKLEMFLCGNIQVMVMKVQDKIVPILPTGEPSLSCPDKIMELMIALLKVNSPCHSDVFLVIGALANAVERHFIRYLAPAMELTVIGLNNREEYQVCFNSVGTIGDISRAVGLSVDPFCDKVMLILHNNLKDEQLNRDVKPPTLSVFGDIAMAIGPRFERFLQESMATIFAACQAAAVRDDDDMVDYINSLRESILEALTGIIQGMHGDADNNIPSRKDALAQYCDPILHFVARISAEVRADPTLVNLSVVRGAIGVMGDLCSVMGAPVREKIVAGKQFVEPLFLTCYQSGDENTKTTAKWAAEICGLMS